MKQPREWHLKAWALRAEEPDLTLREIGLRCGASEAAVYYLFHPRQPITDHDRARSRKNSAREKKLTKTDISSRLGAERLAQQLKAYWAERGYAIQAFARELPFTPTMRSRRWDVCTNLINGLPPGYEMKERAA